MTSQPPRLTLVLRRLWIPLVVLAATATTAVACLSPKPTSLSTSLTGGGKEGAEITVTEGTAVKDTATLSGENAGKATGTVKYAVYKDKECKELVTKAGEVTVKEGKVPASEEKTLEAGAVYYWQAEYGGDSLDEASKSPCGKEVLTVKAKTTLATSLSGGGKEGEEITVAEGSKVKDTATLSGTKASSATGTVHYAVYKDKECKELASKAGEGKVEGTKVASSEEKELEAAAVYYWQAEYLGDSLHEKSTSTCSKEIETVKAAVSIGTSLIGEGQENEEPVEAEKISVAQGSYVGDTATLSGTKVATATGKVKYFVYADEECKELVAKAGEASVEKGSVGASSAIELETEGPYFWQVSYEGDSLHQASTSSCGEVATVLASTSLTTQLSGEGEKGEDIEVSEDAAVTDSATISGTNAAEATGKVKYFVYADEECKELVAKAGEVEVKGAEAPASEKVELEKAGVYYWQAEYSGDSSNHSAKSLCGSEIVVVTPEVTTTLSDGKVSEEEIKVLVGTPVTDKATLHGEHAAEATGKIKYFVYADEECKELVAKAGEVEVKGAEAPASEKVELEKTGVYYWQAEYSGDEKNASGSSLCGTEVSAVVTSTSLTTTLSGGGKEGTKIELNEGTVVSDQATLSGINAGTAEGFVDYTVYSDSKCTEVAEPAGEANVKEGSVGSSAKLTLPAGTYYWQAEYSGDGVNGASKSACGSEILTVTTPITMSLSGEGLTGEEIEVGEGAPVTDKATLHGEHAAEATGKVKYFVYADEECKELVAKAGEVEVKGAEAPASEKVELEKTGVYYWQAEYSGDEKNPKATSTCQSTQEIVWNLATWKYAALGDSFSSGEGVWNTGGRFYRQTMTFGLGIIHGPNHCHRSREAWPALVAERAFGAGAVEPPAVFKYPADRFIFRACSGAETINIWRAGGGPAASNGGQYDEYMLNGVWVKPTPAQLRFMFPPAGGPNNDIAIVSLTIGGNDASFSTIATNCVQRPLEVDYSPAGCQATIANAENVGFTAIEERLPAVLQEIAQVAPRAKIIQFLYPRVLNLNVGEIPVGPFGGGGFRINNVVPGRLVAGFGRVTAAWSVANFIERLNEKIINVARGAGVGARLEINGAMMGALDGHRLGDLNPWVNRIALPHPFTESFHPTGCGHRALAAAGLPWLVRGAAPIGLCPP